MMTDDPYQAPQVDAVVSEPKRKRQRFRWLCFVVNSLVALAVIHATAGFFLVQFLTSSVPVGDAVPAVLSITGVGVYLIGEWLAYMRGRRSIERLLGIANGFLAFFLVCISVTVTVMIFATPSYFGLVEDLTGVLGCVIVATWLGTCAWYRLSRNRVVEKRQ